MKQFLCMVVPIIYSLHHLCTGIVPVLNEVLFFLYTRFCPTGYYKYKHLVGKRSIILKCYFVTVSTLVLSYVKDMENKFGLSVTYFVNI